MPKVACKCDMCGKELLRYSKNPYGTEIKNHLPTLRQKAKRK